MSIRPVDFNGMIQNTSEVSNQKTQEDVKPEIQQQNIAFDSIKKEEQSARSVNQTEEKDEQYRFGDGEGNGRGYEGNKKKKKHEGLDDFVGDGKVIKKGQRHSFDITI